MSYRYGSAARGLHWLTVVLLVVMFAAGLWMTSFAPEGNPSLEHRLFQVHESTGLVVLLVALLRLLVRLRHPPARLPEHIPGLFRFAANANHTLLYALLLLQPAIGFLGANTAGARLVWAGLIPVPSVLGKNATLAPILSDLHWYGAWALLALIAAHLAGVLFHGIIRRDGVVGRML
jgi:cytochrome b561